MKETFTFSAIVHKGDNQYVSFCPELDMSSQGKTIEEAVSNLKETVEVYIEEVGVTLPIRRPFVTTFKITGKMQREHYNESK
jgi:predicted RNase H-like HicB family nuclease